MHYTKVKQHNKGPFLFALLIITLKNGGGKNKKQTQMNS